MRPAKALLIAVLLVGTAAAAAAGDMVLTRTGELYRVAPSDDGLVVSHRFTDGTVDEFLIPQTSGVATSSLQVGVDEHTGAIFVAWQQGEGRESSVELAWLADQWWMGPYSIAGRDGTTAENPQLMIDRFETTIDDDGDTVEFSATFAHLVWWGYTDNVDDGSAYLASFSLDENGGIDIGELEPIALSDLLPYGIGCEGIPEAEGLAHPKIFSDPQSGFPHIFATDFPNCVFQILRLMYEIEEDWVGDTKRRRAITVWRNEAMIAANPDIVLSNAKVEVGHNLDVVMYWDAGDTVAYVQLDENGIPPVQSLPVDDGLSREQAVEIIRALVH